MCVLHDKITDIFMTVDQITHSVDCYIRGTGKSIRGLERTNLFDRGILQDASGDRHRSGRQHDRGVWCGRCCVRCDGDEAGRWQGVVSVRSAVSHWGVGAPRYPCRAPTPQPHRLTERNVVRHLPMDINTRGGGALIGTTLEHGTREAPRCMSRRHSS